MDVRRELESHGYRVMTVLGRNVQGGRITYLVRQVATGQQAVLKHFSFSRADADWAGYKAHQRELDHLRELDHEAIPKFVDAFEVSDGFCLVQEFKEAPSLLHKRYWSFEEAEALAEAMLAILFYLQDRHPAVIHRDIKPDNILRDESGQVYLIDFGLARGARSMGGGAASTLAAGTPGFMAPEQFFNTGVSEASDLYGLGATLVAVLSGVSSDRIATLVDTTFRFRFDAFEVDVPLYFRHWLETMCEPQVEKRFANAREAIEALRRERHKASQVHKVEPVVVVQPSQPVEAVSVRVSTQPEVRRANMGGCLVASIIVLTTALPGLVIPLLTTPEMPGLVGDAQRSMRSVVAPIKDATREMPSEGGRIRCANERYRLKAGVDGAPMTLGDIHTSQGCELTLEGFGRINTIHLGEGSTLTLSSSAVSSIHLNKARATLRGVSVEKTIHVNNSRLVGQDLEVAGSVSANSDSVVEIQKLTSKRVHVSSQGWVKIGHGKISNGASVGDGGELHVSSSSIEGHVNLSGDAVVSLAESEIKAVSLSPTSILVARQLTVRGNLNRGPLVFFVKPGAKLKPMLDHARSQRAKVRLAEADRERLAKQRRERIETLKRSVCRAIQDCGRSETSLEGKVRTEVRFDHDGVPHIKRNSHKSSTCVVSKLRGARGLKGIPGTLTCRFSVTREGGSLLVENSYENFRESRKRR